MDELLGYYKVKINWTNKSLRKISNYIILIALAIFCIWYLVDLPVKRAPAEISFLYYLEFLPSWLLDIFGAGIGLGIVAFILNDIRRNTKGTLKIFKNHVIIESKKRCDIVRFDELKRITFIDKHFSISPYRVEFIYPDFSVKRLKISKTQYRDIQNKLIEVTPVDFEIDHNIFETTQKPSANIN